MFMKMSKIFCSASIIARDLYRVALIFLCIFKIGRLSPASHINVHGGRNFLHDKLK